MSICFIANYFEKKTLLLQIATAHDQDWNVWIELVSWDRWLRLVYFDNKYAAEISHIVLFRYVY